MHYRALLFDLDGTLADTLSSIANCANECARLLNFPEAPLNSFRYMVGEGVTALAKKFLPQTDERTLNEFVSLFRKKLGYWQKKCAVPYPGIPELLKRLEELGIATAVVSNKPQELVDEALKHLFGYHRFSCVIGQRDGLPRKPDPEGILKACESISVPPERTLFLGDTPMDMLAARNAGSVPVGVLWGFRTASELLGAGARLLVGKPLQVLSYLKRVPDLKYILTERLLLRFALEEDLEHFRKFWLDKEANILDHGTPDPGVWTPGAIEKLRQCLAKRPSRTMWTILLLPNLEVIGYIRLRRRSFLFGEAQLGVRLGKPWWGKGYGPEALEKLCSYLSEEEKIRKIELEVLESNMRATKAYKKAGFVPVRRYVRSGRVWQLQRWKIEN